MSTLITFCIVATIVLLFLQREFMRLAKERRRAEIVAKSNEFARRMAALSRDINARQQIHATQSEAFRIRGDELIAEIRKIRGIR